MSYTVNGRNLGVAFSVRRDILGYKALFPHVLTKNQNFTVNFGQLPAPLAPLMPDFIPVGQLDVNDGLVRGSRPPPSRADCEVSVLTHQAMAEYIGGHYFHTWRPSVTKTTRRAITDTISENNENLLLSRA